MNIGQGPRHTDFFYDFDQRGNIKSLRLRQIINKTLIWRNHGQD